MRPNFKNLEWIGFDSFDFGLLRSRYLTTSSPGARKVVLVGRLQRELRLAAGAMKDPLIVDGLYGPHTDHALQIEEDAGEVLGPELRQIVDEERRKKGK